MTIERFSMQWYRCALISLVFVSSAFGWDTVIDESFDGNWHDRWSVTGSVGPADQGAMVGAGREVIATYKTPVKAPAIRVSYDATMTTKPGLDAPSDLSVFVGDLFFQFGGDANAVTAVKSQGDNIAGWLDGDYFLGLHVGKTHKIVAEVNGLAAKLIVDGRVAAQALLKKPLESAEIKLYSWSGIASFDNVKIETQAVADATPPGLIAAVEQKAAEEAERARQRAMPHTSIGELRVTPTIHSVGIEWDIDGDGNHNATCTLRIRKQGEAWREILAPLRIDYRGWYDGGRRVAYRHFNMFAGSAMFLDPGTTYELELTIADPDGGDASRTVTTTTRVEPALGTPSRTLHVTPGDGGGTGTQADPLRGLAAADAAAKPGDLMLLHAGRYARHTFKNGGADGRFVAYKPAGDGDAVIVGHLGIEVGALWFEGLTFVTIDDDPKEFGGIRGKTMGLDDVVIVRNRFTNTRYGVSNLERAWNGDPDQLNRRWFIADNVYEGGPVCEYFTRLFMLADGDICYNRVTTTLNGKGGDGVAIRFCTNMDVYLNDIQNIDDDHFEPDSAYANIRIWRNRARISKFETVSFQPQLASPWYIVQNEVAQFHPQRYGKLFKTNVFDRNVIVGNTFVVRGRYNNFRADIMAAGYSRNNLWVHVYDNPSQATNPGGAIWYGGTYAKSQRHLIAGVMEADWRTDVDYEGFVWDDVPDMNVPFWWGGKRFATPDKMAEYVGFGKHFMRVPREGLFTVDDLLAYAEEDYPSQRLTLRPGSAAVDAGTVVPGLVDSFHGEAPDLGAYELGAPMRHYGPRD